MSGWSGRRQARSSKGERRGWSTVLIALTLLISPRVRARESTPLSATTLGSGRTEVAAFAGFPFLETDVATGLASWLDAGVTARSAWGNMQRLGVTTRARLVENAASGLALRLAADGWLAPVANGRWLALTGEQDFGASADLLWSWATSGPRVVTLDLGYRLVGSRHPVTAPLAGPVDGLAYGSDLGLSFDVELPQARGFVIAFRAGFELHLGGLDSALVMPLVSMGLGQVL